MKRAEVYGNRHDSGWYVEVIDGEIPGRHLPIWERMGHQTPERFPTHAEALAYALATVGLTEKKGDTA